MARQGRAVGDGDGRWLRVTSGRRTSSPSPSLDGQSSSQTSSSLAKEGSRRPTSHKYETPAGSSSTSSRSASLRPSPLSLSTASSHGTQSYVLSPCIVVTTDLSGLSEEAQESAWAAIEVSGRLSRIPSSRCPSDKSAHSKTARGAFVDHQLGQYSRSRCRHELSVPRFRACILL